MDHNCLENLVESYGTEYCKECSRINKPMKKLEQLIEDCIKTKGVENFQLWYPDAYQASAVFNEEILKSNWYGTAKEAVIDLKGQFN